MTWRHSLLSLPFLLAASCVTINVYFPAAAAEQAADRIIDEVWGRKPQTAPEAGQDQSRRGAPSWRRAGWALLDLLVPPAHAAEADIDISSPAIDRLKARMSERHERLRPYYDSGAIGLTADGLIELRDPSQVPLRERNVLNKLVADENADRNALYQEIARSNGRPEWEDDIRATFARRWIDKARSGWWYRQGSSWVQKR